MAETTTVLGWFEDEEWIDIKSIGLGMIDLRVHCPDSGPQQAIRLGPDQRDQLIRALLAAGR